MYKPTLYITMESDPEHYNQEGDGLASRLWSFAAPVCFRPSPNGELGVNARLKCSNRPYWSETVEEEQSNWEDIARPFLFNKVSSMIDVLNGINDKHYHSYEGSLHFNWFKLDLAPNELRFRLDHDYLDNDYIPDIMPLLDQTRHLLNSPEVTHFCEGEEGLAIYLPDRCTIDEHAAIREQEADSYAQWLKNHPTAEEGCEEAPESDSLTAEQDAMSEIAQAVSITEESEPEILRKEDADQESPLPDPAPGLRVTTIEFVKSDGSGLIYDLSTDSWK